jgi:hypothetical protein
MRVDAAAYAIFCMKPLAPTQILTAVLLCRAAIDACRAHLSPSQQQNSVLDANTAAASKRSAHSCAARLKATLQNRRLRQVLQISWSVASAAAEDAATEQRRLEGVAAELRTQVV